MRTSLLAVIMQINNQSINRFCIFGGPKVMDKWRAFWGSNENQLSFREWIIVVSSGYVTYVMIAEEDEERCESSLMSDENGIWLTDVCLTLETNESFIKLCHNSCHQKKSRIKEEKSYWFWFRDEFFGRIKRLWIIGIQESTQQLILGIKTERNNRWIDESIWRSIAANLVQNSDWKSKYNR